MRVPGTKGNGTMTVTLKYDGSMTEADAHRIMVKAEKAAMQVREASVLAAKKAAWLDKTLDIAPAIDAATEAYNAAITQARREYDEALGPWEAI